MTSPYLLRPRRPLFVARLETHEYRAKQRGLTLTFENVSAYGTTSDTARKEAVHRVAGQALKPTF